MRLQIQAFVNHQANKLGEEGYSQLGQHPQQPFTPEALAFLSQTDDNKPRTLPPASYSKGKTQQG